VNVTGLPSAAMIFALSIGMFITPTSGEPGTSARAAQAAAYSFWASRSSRASSFPILQATRYGGLHPCWHACGFDMHSEVLEATMRSLQCFLLRAPELIERHK